jgi:hypothetical protein
MNIDKPPIQLGDLLLEQICPLCEGVGGSLDPYFKPPVVDLCSQCNGKGLILTPEGRYLVWFVRHWVTVAPSEPKPKINVADWLPTVGVEVTD